MDGKRQRRKNDEIEKKGIACRICIASAPNLKTTAHSTPLGTYSKSTHTDLDISWTKASLPGFISTLTRPLLKRETELTEGKAGGCRGQWIREELGDR